MQWAEPLISWLANIIQIATFAFTIWVLWRTRQRLRRHIELAVANRSEAPIALAIGIAGNIEGVVRHYLDTHEMAAIQIRSYVREGLLARERTYEVLSDLHRIKQGLTDLGVTEVHLFYKGPVTLAMGIGSIFDNWVPVKVYSLYHGADAAIAGKYELDLILGKGAVLELLREVAIEGENAIADTVMGPR